MLGWVLGTSVLGWANCLAADLEIRAPCWREIGTERGTPMPQRCGARGRGGAVFSLVRILGWCLHRVGVGAGDFRSWLGELSCCGFGNPRPVLARDRNGARNSDSAAVWSAVVMWSCLQACSDPRPVPSSCWGGCWGLPFLVGRTVLLRIWKSAPRAGAEIETERGTPIPQRCGARGRGGAVFSLVRIPGLSLHRVGVGAGDFRSWLGELSCCGFGNPRPVLARDRNGARNSDSAAMWSAGEGWIRNRSFEFRMSDFECHKMPLLLPFRLTVPGVRSAHAGPG